MCPYYMAMGMTYNEFWYDAPIKAYFYREAHKLKAEAKNEAYYAQGLYNYKAFQAVIEEFAYSLNGRKGSQPKGYLQAPLPLTELAIEKDKQRKKQRTLDFFKKGQG